MKEMDSMWKFIAVYTVANKNIATVYSMSHHLMPSSLRWAELRSAVIHWKNRVVSSPRINRTIEVSTDRRMCGRGYRRELSR